MLSPKQGRDGKPIDDRSVICCSCRRSVIARSSNTSNLLAHLKANHPKIYSEAKESMSTKERPRPSTTQSYSGHTGWSTTSQEKKPWILLQRS